MENATTLDFESFNPETELKKTVELLETGPAVLPAPDAAAAAEPVTAPDTPAAGEKVPTDYKGRPFDPSIHMADENGNPVIKNKNIRIKKGIKQKIKEVFTGKEEENAGFAEEKKDFPQSDHEREKEVRENLAQAEQHAAQDLEMDIHAEDAANAAWMAYSAILGPEAYNQYEKLTPRLKKHFEIFEKRTGKSVDLPPGIALAVGLATVGAEIVRAEPECKARYQAGRDIVVSNLGGYIKNVFHKDENPEMLEEETEQTSDD